MNNETKCMFLIDEIEFLEEQTAALEKILNLLHVELLNGNIRTETLLKPNDTIYNIFEDGLCAIKKLC